jgi:hypothetical protein
LELPPKKTLGLDVNNEFREYRYFLLLLVRTTLIANSRNEPTKAPNETHAITLESGRRLAYSASAGIGLIASIPPMEVRIS